MMVHRYIIGFLYCCAWMMVSGEELVVKYMFVCCLRRELSRERWLWCSGGSYPHWELRLYYTTHAHKTQSRVWELFPEWNSLHGDPRLWVGGSLYNMLCCCIWAYACISQYSYQSLLLSLLALKVTMHLTDFYLFYTLFHCMYWCFPVE